MGNGQHVLHRFLLLGERQSGMVGVELLHEFPDQRRPGQRFGTGFGEQFGQRRADGVPVGAGDGCLELAREPGLLAGFTRQGGVQGLQRAFREGVDDFGAGDFVIHRPVMVGCRWRLVCRQSAQGLAGDLKRLVGFGHVLLLRQSVLEAVANQFRRALEPHFFKKTCPIGTDCGDSKIEFVCDLSQRLALGDQDQYLIFAISDSFVGQFFGVISDRLY